MLPLAITLCLISGFLTAALARPERVHLKDLSFELSLSAGFGLGIFSVVFFFVRLFNLTHLLRIDAAVVVVLAVVYRITRPVVSAATRPPIRHAEDFSVAPRLRPLVIAAFCITLTTALYSVILHMITHSHGDGWDAFAIWNLHARFLFLGGQHWRDGFSALIPWSHPDYPLLLPAAIAHFWTYLGSDSPAVPGIISLVFTIGTLALLYTSLNQIRRPNIAIFATMALASTPFFIEQGAAQYADVPLSFFFLATIALFYFSYRSDAPGRTIVFAGISASFAAWTKNEGLLFLFSALCAQALGMLLRHRKADQSNSEGADPLTHSLRPFVGFFLGALPVLLLILWFKHSIAPPGDLFSSSASMIEKLLNPSRAWTVFRWYVRQFFRFGHWWIAPATILLIVLYLASDRKLPRLLNHGISLSRWTLVFTLAGYFVIYLITPYDIYWHLRFSLSRLFLQVWPSVLFVFFSSISFQGSQNVEK